MVVQPNQLALLEDFNVAVFLSLWHGLSPWVTLANNLFEIVDGNVGIDGGVGQATVP